MRAERSERFSTQGVCLSAVERSDQLEEEIAERMKDHRCEDSTALCPEPSEEEARKKNSEAT